MTKLIPIEQLVSDLRKTVIGLGENIIDIQRAHAFKLIEYYCDLFNKEITKEMFVGDNAIFVGFYQCPVSSNVLLNGDLGISLKFKEDGITLCFQYILNAGDEDTFFLPNGSTVSDISEITKRFPLTLKD
jgi:hypothetical protein